jgi:hypothetical protein
VTTPKLTVMDVIQPAATRQNKKHEVLGPRPIYYEFHQNKCRGPHNQMTWHTQTNPSLTWGIEHESKTVRCWCAVRCDGAVSPLEGLKVEVSPEWLVLRFKRFCQYFTSAMEVFCE